MAALNRFDKRKYNIRIFGFDPVNKLQGPTSTNLSNKASINSRKSGENLSSADMFPRD
jgi:hypothetical protein